MKKPELLAPAGDLERLMTAIDYGADAVYIGGQEFGLRSSAKNFTFEDMEKGVTYAKERNAKVYVTTNIYAHETDNNNLVEYLKKIESIGITGIIVSDPLIINTSKKYAPLLEIHISTQQSSSNYQAVNFWHSIGADRVVLAREMKKEEIKEICEKTNVEIEVFVHGAMCIAYSGRCTLSNNFTLRDSNRGGCVQSCRWNFDLYNETEKINNEEKFSFSAKDLNLVKNVPDLIELGVDCFKIEGRMRSKYYVATVIRAYRKIIDDYMKLGDKFEYNSWYEDELRKTENRKTSGQYFEDKMDYTQQLLNESEDIPTQEFIGVVKEIIDTNSILVEQRNLFRVGDKIEIFFPGGEIQSEIEYIINEDGTNIEKANHPKQLVKINIASNVPVNAMIRKV